MYMTSIPMTISNIDIEIETERTFYSVVFSTQILPIFKKCAENESAGEYGKKWF